jgi:hypothetical protein
VKKIYRNYGINPLQGDGLCRTFTIIIGYSELAMTKTGIDAPVRVDIENILEAAWRMKEITFQLQTFANRQKCTLRILKPEEDG